MRAKATRRPMMMTLLLTLLVLPSGVEAKPPPAVDAAACKGCHEKVFAGTVIHGPVTAGVCLACHPTKGPVPDGEHPKGFFGTKAPDRACLGCHETVKKELRRGKVHEPVSKKRCSSCHDPHSSNTKGLLREASAREHCATCHTGTHAADPGVKNRKRGKKQRRGKKKKDKLGGKATSFAFQHGPYAVGACTTCHSSHASTVKPLLRAKGADLCFKCHQKERFKRKVAHKALEKGCGQCHSGHGSDQKYMLKAEPVKLCGSCHDKLVTFATTAPFKHKSVLKPGCGACHDPHGSQEPKLLRKNRRKICLDCHAGVASDKRKHGPVRSGACFECHKAHGSKKRKLLVSEFSGAFYGQFKEERYELCFDCHDTEILTTQRTRKRTRFRDGDRSLHYVHVVAPGGRSEKGRSCKACHQVHSGPQAKHIRESVPYGTGGWSLPVTFTKTKHGGSCVVGCHSPKEYDRRR